MTVTSVGNATADLSWLQRNLASLGFVAPMWALTTPSTSRAPYQILSRVHPPTHTTPRTACRSEASVLARSSCCSQTVWLRSLRCWLDSFDDVCLNSDQATHPPAVLGLTLAFAWAHGAKMEVASLLSQWCGAWWSSWLLGHVALMLACCDARRLGCVCPLLCP